MEFTKAFYRLMQDEGLWILTNDPDDWGGETFSGISRRAHPQWKGWTIIDAMKGELEDVTALCGVKGRELIVGHYSFAELKGLTEELYAEMFWLPLACQIMPDNLAYEMLEQSVNLGIGRATKHLQTVLNALNNQGMFGPDLNVDGACGPATKTRLAAVLAKGREAALLCGVNGLQCAWYIKLGNQKPQQRKFTNGWLAKRGMIESFIEGGA